VKSNWICPEHLAASHRLRPASPWGSWDTVSFGSSGRRGTQQSIAQQEPAPAAPLPCPKPSKKSSRKGCRSRH